MKNKIVAFQAWAWENGDQLVFTKKGEPLYFIEEKEGLYIKGLSKIGFRRYMPKAKRLYDCQGVEIESETDHDGIFDAMTYKYD